MVDERVTNVCFVGNTHWTASPFYSDDDDEAVDWHWAPAPENGIPNFVV
jgi:hypothetical protein